MHGKGRVENSRSAFEAAIAAGHGIELDVRLSLDGVAMVFHDSELGRLTGEQGPVAAKTAAELSRIVLRGSSDHVATLSEIVSTCPPDTPLLIELKAPGRRVSRLCVAVHRAVEGRTQRVGIMSFNPEVSHWFSRHAPLLTRGLVVTEAGGRWRGAVSRRLALWRARPEFLAYDVRDLPSRFAAAQRSRGLPVLTWTCRSMEDRAKAALHADQIIYET
ncbi:MAG TPA: glycerophosphodiester phosphodiesterase family protein [Allosphingosinicella sp.]